MAKYDPTPQELHGLSPADQEGLRVGKMVNYYRAKLKRRKSGRALATWAEIKSGRQGGPFHLQMDSTSKKVAHDYYSTPKVPAKRLSELMKTGGRTSPSLALAREQAPTIRKIRWPKLEPLSRTTAAMSSQASLNPAI